MLAYTLIPHTLDLDFNTLDTLPVGIALPIRECFMACRSKPPLNWPTKAYLLCGKSLILLSSTVLTTLSIRVILLLFFVLYNIHCVLL